MHLSSRLVSTQQTFEHLIYTGLNTQQAEMGAFCKFVCRNGLWKTDQNNVIILLDLLHELLETLLKLSSVLCTSYQQTHVKGDHLHKSTTNEHKIVQHGGVCPCFRDALLPQIKTCNYPLFVSKGKQIHPCLYVGVVGVTITAEIEIPAVICICARDSNKPT